jgi:hypothetical protein
MLLYATIARELHAITPDLSGSKSMIQQTSAIADSELLLLLSRLFL